MNTNILKGEIVACYGTQNNFAQHMNWNKNKVSRMLTGKYSPNSKEISALAQALSLDERRFAQIFLF